MTHFLKSLIKVSVKAANIARVCREERHLFQLLVQEKNENEKNPKFVQDFKTLADVLIQETIRNDIGKEFPSIAPYIKGEESNIFSNTLGDTITVAIQDREADTAALLTQVLNGDSTAGDMLAAEVHREVVVDYQGLNVDTVPDDLILPLENYGIWIDPIDSTFEYISGSEEPPIIKNIHNKGLQCVTVLIGVFDRQTGQPILGVINQPFATRKGNDWQGNCYWGVNFGDKHYLSHELEDAADQQKMCECGNTSTHDGGVIPSVLSHQSLNVNRGYHEKVVILSSSESEDLKKRLSERGYVVVEAAGAGYKCLQVALGQADAYLLSRGTTYRWDVCGPHALLRAQQGGIIQYVSAEEGNIQELSYFESEDEKECEGMAHWCNKDGVIAYRNVQFLREIILCLKGS